MTVYRLSTAAVGDLPDRPLSIALGNFDGVHIGHQKLLRAARDAAGIAGCDCAVWTFTSLVKSDASVPSLTTQEEKRLQFARAGMDYAIFEDFSAVRSMSAEEFVEEYLLHRLRAAAVVCGFNFHFGRNGTGDAAFLRDILVGHGVPLTVIEPVCACGGIVSSTRIRAALAEGNMESAAEMLGRPFSVSLPVLHGNALGRTIGLPTINQDFPAGHIIPAKGIYACLCHVGERICPGVANIGSRPSVPGDGHINCETHIIGYDGDLYGETVRVEFFRRLRDERKFPSLEALQSAIRGDIAAAREYFASRQL